MNASALEEQAASQLAAILNLPPAGGTARNIVSAIVQAAVARIQEAQPVKQTISLPRKDNHK